MPFPQTQHRLLMNKFTNVLIVEDEPLITNSLKNALKTLNNALEDTQFKIKTAEDCDTALIEIDNAVKATPFDLAILDVSIPPAPNKKIFSGEDLGLELRSLFPDIKIVVFTTHNDNYRINNILKSLNPDGFLIKSDVDFKGLIEAINTVLSSPPYYSKGVLSLVRLHISNDFVLDKIDRELLYQLSKGTKTKDLPNFIRLSKGGIERRKRNLREVFCVENGNDKLLIKLAKEKGFI